MKSGSDSGTFPEYVSEELLIADCREQRPRAQRAFYEIHRKVVLSALYRITGPNAPLEDLLQEVFLVAFRGIKDFRGDSKLSTWLYRISVNVALGWIRRRKVRSRVHFTDRTDDFSAGASTAESILVARTDLELVYSILGEMSPKKQVAFVLHEIEGYSLKEIAKLTNSKAVTARTRLHYARKYFYGRWLEVTCED